MMAKYIKSYSNYVLKSKHQATSDGTIYERDITTIGGRDQFAKNQVPIFKSGNFVITVNNDSNKYKKVSSKPWFENESGPVWNADIIKNHELSEKTSYDEKLVIKNDYYDLRDYAYYGSCSELIRASITDILKKYPGELFVPFKKQYIGDSLFNDGEKDIQYTKSAADYSLKPGYSEKYTGLYDSYKSYDYNDKLSEEEKVNLENGMPYEVKYGYIGTINCEESENINRNYIDVVAVDNPFGINIHDRFVPKGENPLKYFAEGGVENFVAYKYDFETESWDMDTEYTVEIISSVFEGIGECESSSTILSINPGNCSGDCKNAGQTITLNLSAETVINTDASNVSGDTCFKSGDYLGFVELGFKRVENVFSTVPPGVTSVNSCDDCENGGIPIGGEGSSGETVNVISYKYDKIDDNTLKIYLFIGEDYKVRYFVENFSDFADDNRKNFSWRIRPRKKIINDFFNNELDSFEKLLLNRNSYPIYTSNFELIGENSFGFYTYTKQFTFPTTYGGYNLGSSGPLYSSFVNDLIKISEFYDEKFSDNLWRSMTHEAIKNFDWTYTRHYNEGDEKPYIEGGSKIQKVIRLFGREFDEIKNYTTSISNNSVSYNDSNNLPDYFFTDKLEDEGWDVKLVKPLKLSEYVNDLSDITTNIEDMFCSEGIYKKNIDGTFEKCSIEDARKENVFYLDDSGLRKFIIKRNFIEQFDDTYVVPFSKSRITTIRESSSSAAIGNGNETVYSLDFSEIGSDSCLIDGFSVNVKSKTGEYVANGYHNDCGNLIRIYSDETRYTPSDVNNEFMRRLIVNSRQLWANKGTINGMEMLLSLFGLKSKNYVFNNPEYFSCNSKNLKREVVNDIEQLVVTDNNIEQSGVGENISSGGAEQIGMGEIRPTIKANSAIKPVDNGNTIIREGYFDALNQRILSDTNYLTPNKAGSKYYEQYKNNLNYLYDYEIKEYTMFTAPIDDQFLPDKNMFRIDWINSKKLITYNTDDFKNGIYVNYQGLPVSFQTITSSGDSENEGSDVIGRKLYPHFESNGIYDGNPYYQMNGGWLQKRPFAFDVDNNIILEDSESNKRVSKGLFIETVKNIHCVNTLQSLLSDVNVGSNTGDIVQVLDLSGRFAIIDGIVYPLMMENDGTGESFFYVDVVNNGIIVGKTYFSDYVIISNPYKDGKKQRIDLSGGYYNNKRIKIYLITNNDGYGNNTYSIDVYSDSESISTFTVFENGKYMDGDNFTNYFKLNNADYKRELSILGWQQLKKDEFEYYRLNMAENYSKGNNPHYGNMRYDNGHEYLTYFTRLFKHTIDNDLLDYRQFNKDDYRILDKIVTDDSLVSMGIPSGVVLQESFKDIGFKNLLNEDESCDIDYDKFLRLDNKCHYFGNVLQMEENKKFSKMDKKCKPNKKREFGSCSGYTIRDIIRDDYIDVKPNYAKINDLRYAKINTLIGEEGLENDEEFSGKVTSITDQIINTKRMEIDFFIRGVKEYSKDWLEEVKYIDSIILPYLTQMMPSGVICRINYKTVA